MPKHICVWCGAEYSEETASQECMDNFQYKNDEPLHVFVREEEVQDWYFTFGFGHAYPNQYAKFKGTFGIARAKMFQMYGDKWAFQYNQDEFPEIARRWGFTEVQHAEADK
jgi:hypothetical protein